MDAVIITTIVIAYLICIVIGGLILWGLARGVGKIENAKFGNSVLVSLISSLFYFALFYILYKVMGVELAKIGLGGMFAVIFVLLALSFVTIGKMVWKCSIGQSIKANIIWLGVWGLSMGYVLQKFSLI